MSRERGVRFLNMAKARFTNRTTEIIKAKYVEKKTFKWALIALGCVSGLLLASTHRLYVLGEFNAIIKQSNNYYTLLMQFIKGLF